MIRATIETVTKMLLLAEVIPDPEQLARHTPERIAQLAGDMAARGLHQAIGVMPTNQLIFGHARYMAAKSLGWAVIEARVYPAGLSESQVRTIRATENLQRTDLTGYLRWQLCEDLLRLNPAWKGKDLAEHLSLHASTITYMLSPGKCLPAVHDALKAGHLTLADTYRFSQVSEEQQHELLAVVLSGATAGEVGRRVRKARTAASEVRMSRVKIPLGGTTVVITGQELGMAEVVDTLTELLKEARKAAETYDVSTWQKMMRDKASRHE
jgi:ParB/RepB/Spo0J family partition protein